MPQKPKWIWLSGEREAIDMHALFRRTFQLPQKPVRAELELTCSHRYWLYVNGHLLGVGPNFCDPAYQYVDSWDVTKFLRPGLNCLAVVAHNVCLGTHYSLAQPGGLWGELRLDLRHNMQTTIPTDSSWKVLARGPWQWPVPRVYWTNDFQEHVLPLAAPRYWTQPAFDDSRWQAALELGKPPLEPWQRLLPREIPHLALDFTEPARLLHVGRSLEGNHWYCNILQPAGELAFHFELETSQSLQAPLFISADDEYLLELDGTAIARHALPEGFVETMSAFHRKLVKDEFHYGVASHRRTVPLELSPGRHELILRLKACPGTWGAQLHLPQGVKVTSTAVSPLDAGGIEPLEERFLQPYDAAVLQFAEQVELAPAPNQPPLPLELGTETNFATFDFAAEGVGVVELSGLVRGRGALELAYAEILRPDGRPDVLRGERAPASVLHFEGGPRRRFEWRFVSRHAARYLAVAVRGNLRVKLEKLGFLQTRYPLELRGDFECSDLRLQRIWRVGADTVAACMGDNWEDCPTREHAQYPGDVYVEFPVAAYAFGDYALSAKGLRQIARGLDREGFVNGRWPSSEVRPWLLNYSLFWISWLRDHVRWSGELALAKELFGSVLAVLAYHRRHYAPSGLLRMPGKFHLEQFVDHTDVDSRGESTGYQANFYKALNDAAWLAELLHQPHQARLLHLEARKLQQRALDLLFVPAVGAYADCRFQGELVPHFTLQSNAWAIWSGLAPQERWETLYEALQQLEVPQVTNPWAHFFTLEALARLGRYAEGLELVRRYWGAMLDRGAVTWWEAFSPEWPEGELHTTSFCHGWSAAPTYFLLRHIAGIDWTCAPTPKLLVKPHCEAAPPFTARVPTPLGEVKVEWNGRDCRLATF